MSQSLLCPDAFLSLLEIDDVVTRALAEDLGRAGDVTSIATIPEDAIAHAIVVARKAGVIAGLPLVAAAFRKLAPDVAIVAHVRDGARARAGHLVKIEIEVDGLDQLGEVLALGLADAVLLDNMNVADISKAVTMIGGRFPLEASGGITLESIEAVASTGVDYASSGWI